ncbi:uncharacterized protein LOC114520831 [Dendronephthya gigantea]|uniref:uncharacterized protein LOC114520831 n=1 Tax=Dendronephthya gigantea TaxID=151771 RepID=UPI00106AA948|nr:uncharacterized protein LOC114520831 [Dendronephthya gigantea]
MTPNVIGTSRHLIFGKLEIWKNHDSLGDSLTNGIYWISLEKPGKRNVENSFPVFCDMQAGGWTLVFKTVSGNPLRKIARFWKGNDFSRFSPAALNKNPGFREDYKNRIVHSRNWRTFGPKEARVVLYKNGKEQLVLRFNASSSTYMNWFSHPRLLESPWNDLAGSTFNYFKIEGPCWNEECRDFHINFFYITCDYDVGWLAVSSMGITDGCDWEKRFPGNSFIFSKIGKKVNYNQYDDVSGDSDVFAVYVR